MRLSIEAIKDYQHCPMLYYYNHIERAIPSKNSTIEKFAFDSLKKTFYWFFHELQDNNKPTLKGIRDKFGDLYIRDRTYLETMLLDTKSKARVLENRCVSAIHNFYETYKDDRGVPLLVNKPYSIRFGDVILDGTVPVIRETQYKDVQLISFVSDIFVNNKKQADYKVDVERDIDIIASSLAFKQMYKWDVDIHTAYGANYNNHYVCNVNGALNHNLEKIVTQVSTAIDNKIFYPVYNDKCRTCAYRNKCLKEW